MRVVMVAVVSANGKLTRGDDPNIYQWTSREDQHFFFSQVSESNLIVMGSGTYEAVRKQLRIQNSKLRIVLTRNPEQYKKEEQRGMLEFSSETPRELVARLRKKYKQMLLVGGGRINSAFLKDNLIDEIYLTIEPTLFGKGKNLFTEDEFESSLTLASVKKLNKKGTVLFHYKIVK